MDQDPKPMTDVAPGNQLTGELNSISETPEVVSREPVTTEHVQHDVRLPGDKEKRRRHMIVGLIIGVILAVLGGVAAWFFVIYSNPEKVMFDGISNLLRAPSVALDGGGGMVLREGREDDLVQMVLLDFDVARSDLPSAANASLLVILHDGRRVRLGASAVQMADDEIYLQVSGVMESLRDTGLDTELESELEAIFATFEEVDDEWWRVSPHDLLEGWAANAETAEFYGEVYNCALASVTSRAVETLADVYAKHGFISAEPVSELVVGDGFEKYQPQAWHKLYQIRLDRAQLADFVNALSETAAAEDFYACYNQALTQSDLDSEQLRLENLAELAEDDIMILDRLNLYVEVSQFSHQIRSFWAYTDDEVWNNVFTLMFSYQDASVAAPNEYRDFAELWTDEYMFVDLWNELGLPNENAEEWDWGWFGEKVKTVDPPSEELEETEEAEE